MGEIRICPECLLPTFFNELPLQQIPGARPGDSIKHLPNDVESLYNEARKSHAAGAHTAAVLSLRKLLMHVAVEKKAKKGLSFVDYVEYLGNERYLGRDGKGWVDLIRSRSNEANHEIILMQEEDSTRLLMIAEMLLKLVYEFPGSLPQPAAVPAPAKP